MKNDMLITFRSITFAQKGEQILRRGGVDCTLQRTPRELSQRGCGYCLRIRPRDGLAAVELLRRERQPYSKLYAITESGRPEERQL